MSGLPVGESESVGDRGGWGKKRKAWSGRWSHLPVETRERYEAIEDRVREKVERGEL